MFWYSHTKHVLETRGTNLTGGGGAEFTLSSPLDRWAFQSSLAQPFGLDY